MSDVRPIRILGLAALALASSFACAEEFNNASYKSIAAKASQLQGPPVEISTNYWLAWTGAWDTVIMKEAKIWEKWLPKAAPCTGSAICRARR